MAARSQQPSGETDRPKLGTIKLRPQTSRPPQPYRGPHIRSQGRTKNDPFARGLGWFSNGLGMMAVGSPGTLARLIGVTDSGVNRQYLRLVGMREMASGVSILTQPHSTPWLRSRVAGDLMDLVYLTGALVTGLGRNKSRVAIAMAGVLGVTAIDLRASMKAERGAAGPGHILQSITIARPVEEVYQFWRNLENLPRFMSNLESVQEMGERRSHWKAKVPAGQTVEWDAELVEDRPTELIRWRSLPHSEVYHAGQVEFHPAPGNRGTEIQVDFSYEPPAGQLGQLIARLFSKEPGQQVPTDLRRVKQILEAGEIVQSDSTVYGASLLQRPAKPVEAAA
jgi:uncharacterized membrane protein